MLFLKFSEHLGKEDFHLILELRKLGDLCMWIIVKNVLEFRPFHLLAVLVKQRSLLPVYHSILADKTWFSTLRVDADMLAWISIDAFRYRLELFESFSRSDNFIDLDN
jgi:hypothetical protein